MANESEVQDHVPSEFSADDQALMDQMRDADSRAPEAEPEGEAEAEALEAAESDIEADEHEGDEPEGDGGAKEASDDSIPPSKRPPISYWKHQKQIKKLKEENARILADFDGTKSEKTRLEERLNIVYAAINSKKEEEAAKAAPATPVDAPVIPDPEEDPIGFIKYQASELERLNKRVNEGETQTQQSHQEREVTEFYKTDAQAFASQTPDFGAAYTDLMNKRMALYAVNEFGKDIYSDAATDKLSPTEIAKINKLVALEEQQVVMAAINQRQSPAQRIYNLARANGYRAEAPKPAAAAPANGKAPAAAPAVAPTVSDALKNIRAGKEASASLSDAGGVPSSETNAKMMMGLNDTEFGAMIDGMTADQLDAILGK